MNRARDFLVGIVFFGLLFVLGAFTIFLADFRLGAAETMTVAFERVDGLAVGANVWIDGVKSGRVESIRRGDPVPVLDDGTKAPRRDEDGNVVMRTQVFVDLKFDGSPGLRHGATVRVDSLSLLGGKVVSIRNGTGKAFEKLPDDYPGDVQESPLAKVQAVADRIDRLVQANEKNVADTIANLAAASGKLTNDDGTGLIDQLATASAQLNDASTPIGKLLYDKDLAKDLDVAAERIAAAARKLSNETPGEEPGIAEKLAEVAGRLTKTDNTLGRLLNDAALIDELEAAMAGIRSVTAQLESGEGTLGKLLYDRKLAEDLADAVSAIKSFTGGLDSADAKAALASLRSVTAKLDAALEPGNQDSAIGLLLNDPQMAEDLKRSVKAMSDFLESQRENAPLTTFAGLLFKPF